jgi:hypothetical protein
MIKKINFMCLVAILALQVSCKKEVGPSENDSNPRMDEKHGLIRPEEVQKEELSKPVDGKYPVMTFAETEFDFGEINQGDKVDHIFSFKNTGEADLIITYAQASCGCTVPEYPKEAIKPGESGKIKVTFNSAGKSGQTMKTITISCNTQNNNELLKIKTFINVPNKEQKK